MDRATISRIESWDALTVPGGYAGLSDLAEDDFTGAVEAGGTRMFMLNGRVVGVFDGSISAFDGAESTAYEAPDPALPLLFAMQERGGEVRGKYYTDDTPLQEVDQTLTEGGFTGYLELSENVLSGDYYVAYYGGRSLAAAFIGNEGRVVTGREAFDLAADEVGIYEVRSVDIEVSEIPEPSQDEVAAAGAVEETAPEEGPAEPEPDAAEPEPETDAAASEPEESAGAAEAEAFDEVASEEPTDAEPADSAADEESPAEVSADVDEDEPAIPDAEAEAPDAAAEASDADESPAIEDADAAAESADEPTTARASDPSPTETGGSGGAASPGRSAKADAGRPVATEGRPEPEDPDERFREEERWREARTVPALDPDESVPPGAQGEPASQVSVDPQEPEPKQVPGGADQAELQALYDRVDELEDQLESTNLERRQQAERVEKLIEERDELLDERQSLEARIEELEAKIEDQASRIEGQERELAEAASGGSGGDTGAASASNAVDPQTALDQTDLFVRYGSKGKATLQTAHDRSASKEDVADNLRLETHSRFDPAGTTVSGRPFDDYLADTIEYRFVSWLVEELLYEIQETGSEKALRALYDALPRIDRAEFNGTITGVDEEGEENQESFDVVCRDRMGKPLVVANINDSLDPATGEMMGGLVESATTARRGVPRDGQLLRAGRPGDGLRGDRRRVPLPRLEEELRETLSQRRLPPLAGRGPWRGVPRRRPRVLAAFATLVSGATGLPT